MHIEFLVEEPSAEAALLNLVPKIMGPEHSFRIHSYQGKDDLMRSLPGRLLGYAQGQWLPSDWRIVVLRDRDQAECHQVKSELDELSVRAGLVTKSDAANGARFHVMNRLAIEELEAWFFGDGVALHAAYPRVSESIQNRATYRVPDDIRGGTEEALQRVLRRAGYHSGGVPQIATARAISQHMDPERNHSHSFQVFRDGLRELIG